MKYLRGYKYQLAQTEMWHTDITPPQRQTSTSIKTEFTFLSEDGTLIVYPGYAWEGARGRMLIPSLLHDAFYQLIRQGHLPPQARQQVDRLFYDLCITHKVNRLRAWYAYRTMKNPWDVGIPLSNVRKVFEV